MQKEHEEMQAILSRQKRHQERLRQVLSKIAKGESLCANDYVQLVRCIIDGISQKDLLAAGVSAEIIKEIRDKNAAMKWRDTH